MSANGETPADSMPDIIRVLFEHVRALRPDVRLILFGLDGRVLFFNDRTDLIFMPASIDEKLVRAASQIVAGTVGFPAVYET